jgi:tRNA(Ile)-lysidine synthase
LATISNTHRARSRNGRWRRKDATVAEPRGAEPLTDAEFGAALAAIAEFERAPFLAVAVSGGPDSLALTILADRWARARGGDICALTVDHRLRPESADEVRRLGAWLAMRGIRHEVLVWAAEKPATGIEAKAREARYRLLLRWCREQGCLNLLTAHHCEDQSETYLIRRRAGSGPDGLAGMSAVREFADCRLLRPLLGIEKARLAAFLSAEGQPAIIDPSNLDPAFERARLRRAGAAAATTREPAEIAALLARLGAARQRRGGARDRLLARVAMLHPAGFAVLDPVLLRAVSAEPAERALAAAAMAIGGAAYPPRRARLSRLRAALFGAGADPNPPGRTLGGCRFVGWRGRILVLREVGAAAGPVSLAPGAVLRWDRRFRVDLDAAATAAVVVGYLGHAGVAEFGRRLDNPLPAQLPRLVYPVLPAVWDTAGLVAVPGLGWRRDGVGPMPQIVLRPVNCLSAAPFAVVSPSAHLMCSQDENGRGPSPNGVG